MVNDNYTSEHNKEMAALSNAFEGYGQEIAALADNSGELFWINKDEVATKEKEDTLESYYRAELQQLNLIAKLNTQQEGKRL